MATIRKRGDQQYHVQVRRKSISATKTFALLTQAKAWARKVESEIDSGNFISSNEAESTTLKDLIERYKIEVVCTMRAQSQELSRLKKISELLGHKLLAHINSSILMQYRNIRLESIAVNSVNREMTTLLRLMSYAQDDCKIHLPQGKPVLKKISTDDSRERRVSDEEINLIVNHTKSEELGIIIHFTLQRRLTRRHFVISELQFLSRV